MAHRFPGYHLGLWLAFVGLEWPWTLVCSHEQSPWGRQLRRQPHLAPSLCLALANTCLFDESMENLDEQVYQPNVAHQACFSESYLNQ